jgi:[ribosomal protein S5]-alanine N-acetyltransferase
MHGRRARAVSEVVTAALVGSPVTLLGATVELVPFTPACITSGYLGWLNDRELMRYSRQRLVCHTTETALAHLAEVAGTPSHFWSLRLRRDGQPVGTVTARVDSRAGVADVGFLVAVRGRGLGRETCGVVLDFLCRHAGLRKVTGGTVRVNTAMVRIFEGWGMATEGVQREQEIVDDHPCDIVLFGLLAREWGAAPLVRVLPGGGSE